MSDQDADSPVKPKKSRTLRGKEGRAKLKEIQKTTRVTQETEEGFYTGCVNRLFQKIKSGTMDETLKVVGEDDDDVAEKIIPAKFVDKNPSGSEVCTTEALLVLSDDDGEVCELLSVRDSSVQNVNTNALKSPSPPPPPVQMIKKPNRRGKNKKKLLSAVDNLTKDLTSAQAQLRSDTRQSMEPDVCVIEDEDRLTIRVDIRGAIQRYSLRSDEPFSTIVSQIASIEDVPHKYVMFVHNDKTLRSGDTPASVNFNIADIIECHILEKLEDSFNNSYQEDDPNCIELVVQSRSSKHRELIVAHINRPLSTLIEEYARRTHKSPAEFVFRFDGDIVKPQETPEMLDIEDGDILDVQEVDVQVISC